MKKILVFSFLALLIGVIYIYPDIRFIVESGKGFRGITLTATADEAFYLSRLNGVYKGDTRLANVGLYEHRNDPWLMPPYVEVIIGSIGKALKIPVQYLDIILSFVFPIIIFWLIYMLVSYLSCSKKLGILGSFSIIFGYALFTFDYNIFKEIVSLKYSQPLWFLRPFSPQLIYIPFILSLLLIFKFIDTDKKCQLALITLSIASLNYLHIFLWAFLIAGLFAWLIIAIFIRQKKIFINITTILILLIFLSIPYWMHHYRITLNPAYPFLEKIFGIEYSHRPVVPIPYILASLLIVFLRKGSSSKDFYFIFSFLAGGVICLNQQVITGRIMEQVHFTSYTNKTFMIIALISGLNKLNAPKQIVKRFSKKHSARILNTIFILTLVFLCSFAFMQQDNYFHTNKKRYSDLQLIKPAVDWLNRNTKKYDVVLTDSIKYDPSVSNRLLLSYTNNYYYNGFDCDTLFQQVEQENRIMHTMYFFRYSSWEAESVFNFSNCVIFLGMSSRYNLVDNVSEHVARLKGIYTYLMSKDSIELLRKYKVDYVLVGKKDHLFNTMEKEYPDLVKLFDDSNYKVYRFPSI